MKSNQLILEDSEGTKFIRVREANIPTDGSPGEAELWQRVGQEGPDQPFYGRRLPTPGVEEAARFFSFA